MKNTLTILFTLLLAWACVSPDNGNNGSEGEKPQPTGPVTVRGIVYGGGTNTLEGVVISDGIQCVKSNAEGYFEMNSDLSKTKFIMASIPSGYAAPVDDNGLPIFYHRVTDEERKANMCTHTFDFHPITNNPDRYTLIIGADPQPRASTAGWDQIAYHSLDICNDFYLDMKETAAEITDRNVYGMMLGDLVHENMSLYDNYIVGLKSLGFPMFNILGNHDNDPAVGMDDVTGRHTFEEKLGPTYYSFNIGKQHYVVLDNLIMKQRENNGGLRDYNQGLTDEIWQWLQNDLAMVDRSTTIMVAAHSPMFKLSGGSDRSQSSSTKHGTNYAELLSKYAKVHAWAGHNHTSFNYVYPASSPMCNIEAHTVARSTGDLWTNEYLAYNTPRGYTVVEVDGDDISWYFKPTKYQKAAYTGKTSPKPSYTQRDWTYNDGGVAKMTSTGETLDESYQMKVYKPGEYNNSYSEYIDGKAGNKYVYVDVFLWDEKWETPKYNGQTMTRVTKADAYSLSHDEIRNHYYLYGYKLKGNEDYAFVKSNAGDLHTLFRAYESKSSGSGTVTVTDRFGNKYSSSVSW